ncbi:MAG: fibronectin type III domain-containing protein [Candidatus Kerfeldbacteria bacterium]|nr:fibronectin type III domain-containing protein [Candidatus Kerfeldbacteria bacterium]
MALIQDNEAHRVHQNGGQPAFGRIHRKVASGFLFAVILSCGLLLVFAVAAVYPTIGRLPAEPTGYQDRLTNTLAGTIHQGAETVLPTDEAVATARQRVAGGDFTLLVVPDLKSTKSDTAISYDLRIVRSEQFDDPVAVSAVDLPSGVTVTADPAVVPVTEEAATLRMNVAGDAPEGNYTWTIVAKGQTKVHTAPAGLTITDVAISDIRLAQLEPMQQGSGWQATITWKTDVPANTWVDYAPEDYFTANGLAYAYTNVEHVNTTDHSATLVYLQPDTVYHFRIRSVDALNNLVVSSDRALVTKAE